MTWQQEEKKPAPQKIEKDASPNILRKEDSNAWEKIKAKPLPPLKYPDFEKTPSLPPSERIHGVLKPLPRPLTNTVTSHQPYSR